MIEGAIGFLRCPQCDHGGGLTRTGGSLRCAAGHCFDIARAGYVSLLPAGAARNSGDTPAMVQARDTFLTAGHFAGLANAVAETAAATLTTAEAGLGANSAAPEVSAPADPRQAESAGATPVGSEPATAPTGASTSAAASSAGPGCVVDCGAGTGYYLAAVLDRLPSWIGLALDISKNALRLAARAHPRAVAVGCDAWRPLPVADEAADLVLNIFAPRDPAELRRLLRPAGALVLATPEQDHLRELVGPLGLVTVDDRKEARLADKLGPYFELAAARDYRAALALGHRAVRDLVAMGPSSWHADPADLAVRISQLPDPVTVTLAVRIATYRPARTT
jgi:23S rRNA (guanine745-N1)-methyltransferase